MLGCRSHRSLPPCGGLAEHGSALQGGLLRAVLPSMARHYRAGLLRAALPSMARHYRLDDCALLIPGRSRRQAAGRAEPCSAAVDICHCPLAGACRAWLGTTGLDCCALPCRAWLGTTGLDCCVLSCRAWLGTTGWMIGRCSSRDDRAGRAWVEPSHARLPLASAIAPLRGPAEHGAALPGWIIARGPAEHGSALPGWIVARCLAEHGSALPLMQKSRLSPALLDYLPLTCLIRRRLRLIWRSVRTFFLPSYGFTPSRKMNCTGVPTSLKRLRKKFSR